MSSERAISGDIPGGIDKFTINRSLTNPSTAADYSMDAINGYGPEPDEFDERGSQTRNGWGPRTSIEGQAEEVSSEDELVLRPRSSGSPHRANASGYEAEAGLFSTGSAPDMSDSPRANSATGRGDVAGQEVEAVEEEVDIDEADQMIFDQVFDVHPFAAAAFLRAFVSCSTGLMFFHIHSLSVWPTNITEVRLGMPQPHESHGLTDPRLSPRVNSRRTLTHTHSHTHTHTLTRAFHSTPCRPAPRQQRR